MEDVVVSVICLAYNHGKYIRQALEGFLRQKTSFRFEVLINDDASTDNTQEILREYELKHPDIFRIFYQTENRYLSKMGCTNSLFLCSQAKGKYLAICEGDDYWFDESKLQRQVDILEQHPECSACCCNALVVQEDCTPWGVDKNTSYFELEDKIYGAERLVNDLKSFHTATLMVRKSVLALDRESTKRNVQCKSNGDMKWAAIAAATGKLYHISRSMACYRFVPKGNGSWSARNEGKNLCWSITKMILNIQAYIKAEYGVELDYHLHLDYQTRCAIKHYLKNKSDENKEILKLVLGAQKSKVAFVWRSLVAILNKPKQKRQIRQKEPGVRRDMDEYRSFLSNVNCWLFADE